jgi:hypothetical protein
MSQSLTHIHITFQTFTVNRLPGGFEWVDPELYNMC